MNEKLKIGLLLENEYINKYIKDLLEWSLNEPNIEITHYIISKNRFEENSSKLNKILNGNVLNNRFKKIIMKFEEKRNLSNSRNHSSLSRKYSISEFDIKRFEYDAIFSKSGISVTFSDHSIDEIKKLNLDVLLRFNKKILRGNILNLNKFGIISLHLGDDLKYRGGPSGFWEVYNKEVNSGFIIQQLTENLDNGNILFRGNISTEKTWLLNRAELNLRAFFYLKETIKQISIKKMLPTFLDNIPYTDKIYKSPTNYQLFKYLYMRIQNKLNDSIFNNVNNRYSVGFQKNHWGHLEYRKSKFIDNEHNTFNADPFLLEHNGRHYCFVETFNYLKKKAKINVYELFDNNYEFLGTALEESFHLSFPYVFKSNNEIYMIPESSKNLDIRLYKCIDFPLNWKLEKVLIDKIDAADSLVFYKDDKWWMLTNEDPLALGNHNYNMNIYYSNELVSDNWQPHKNNPIIMNSEKGRNGGILFNNQDVFRVSQQFGFYKKYGENFAIHKIENLNENAYSEKTISTHSKFFSEDILGSHHIHSNNTYSVFDIWKKH